MEFSGFKNIIARVVPKSDKSIQKPTRGSRPKEDEYSDICRRFFGLVRNFRIQCQDLLRTLEEVKTKAGIVDPPTRTKELAAVFSKIANLFDGNKVSADNDLSELNVILGKNPTILDDLGEEHAHLEVLWRRVLIAWPTPDLAPEVVLDRAKEAAGLLGELIYHCAFVTIAPRVDQHLDELRPGESWNFNDNFKDELPELKDRNEILEYLQSHPLTIQGGIVDAPTGLIVKISREPRDRKASLERVSLWLLSGFIVITGLCLVGGWAQYDGWPMTPDKLWKLFAGYTFILLGSAAHLIVGALKQNRSGNSVLFAPLEDPVLWVHVKENSIIMGVVSLWVGLAFLIFAMGPAKFTWSTAFFVGYGIDSIVDIVLKRFDTLASGTVAKVVG